MVVVISRYSAGSLRSSPIVPSGSLSRVVKWLMFWSVVSMDWIMSE